MVMKEALILFKMKFLKLASFLWLFLAPIHFILALVGIAIFVDTFYGRKTARIVAIRNGKDPRIEVKSKITRERLSAKMLVYNACIISCFIIDKNIMNDLVMYLFQSFPIHFAVTKFVGLVFLFIEVDSIDEHFYKIKGVRMKDLFKKKIGHFKNSVVSAAEFKNKIK